MLLVLFLSNIGYILLLHHTDSQLMHRTSSHLMMRSMIVLMLWACKRIFSEAFMHMVDLIFSFLFYFLLYLSLIFKPDGNFSCFHLVRIKMLLLGSFGPKILYSIVQLKTFHNVKYTLVFFFLFNTVVSL